MFNSLLLHDSVATTLAALATKPPQGLLLVGPAGIGKTTVAHRWANHIATDQAAVQVIAPDEKGTISIDTIRELYKAARTRQEGRQVIIITEVDGMSIEAENAFLKLLEEPRAGLTFILTAANTESLLPTVLSRVQLVSLQPLSDDAIRRFVVAQKPGIAQGDLAQLVFLANGRAGAAQNLMNSDVFAQKRQTAQLAKQLLTAKPYERFLQIGKLAADRQTCLDGLMAMQRIVEVQLRTSQSPTQVSQWAHIANLLDATLTAIQNNGNMRAQLLYLFTSY